MYVLTVYQKQMDSDNFSKKLINVLHYKEYEHALGDACTGSPEVYGNLSEDVREGIDFSKPWITFGASGANGCPEEITLRYPYGVYVVIEKPCIMDEE